MIRLINAPIRLEFDLYSPRHADFEREFINLSETVSDPTLQWVKMARARGETEETDTILLNLLVELHKKIDRLESHIKGDNENRLLLANRYHVDEIGYDHIALKEPLFAVGEIYYARADLPIFPKREVPIIFRAIEEHLGVIERIHDRDRADWDGYIVSREREIIREMKENDK